MNAGREGEGLVSSVIREMENARAAKLWSFAICGDYAAVTVTVSVWPDVSVTLCDAPPVILQACQIRLEAMRLKHLRAPPDGFVVFDSSAREVERWFRFVRD